LWGGGGGGGAEGGLWLAWVWCVGFAEGLGLREGVVEWVCWGGVGGGREAGGVWGGCGEVCG